MAVTQVTSTVNSSLEPNTQEINTLKVRMTEQEALLSDKVPEITSIAASVTSNTTRQTALEGTFSSLVINAGGSNAEIVVARGGEVDLSTRLSGVDTQLAKSTNNFKPSWSDWEEFEQRGINVKWFGAIGNGIVDDSQSFINALNFLKALRISTQLINGNTTIKGGNLTLQIPPGRYRINSALDVPKGISVRGCGENSTILFTEGLGCILNLSDVTVLPANDHFYTTISDLTIAGPNYGRNPFEAKDQTPRPSSNGIQLTYHKVRISNCTIDGFFGDGIVGDSVYYIFISGCFVLNNRIGLDIRALSTSFIVTNTEFRLNSIGTFITSSSFGNFFTDCIYESNISNYLPIGTLSTLYNRGKAFVFDGSTRENFVSNCYIENHYETFNFKDTKNNVINNNIIVLSLGVASADTIPYSFYGGVISGNTFDNNSLRASSTNNPNIIKVRVYSSDLRENIFKVNTACFDGIIASSTEWATGFLGVTDNAPVLIDMSTFRVYKGLLTKTIAFV